MVSLPDPNARGERGFRGYAVRPMPLRTSLLLGRVLAASLVLAFLAAPARAADDPAGDAMAAVRRSDSAEALRASEVAISRTPATALAWNVRAYVLSWAGRKEDALRAYEKAASLDPKDVLSRANRGSVLLALDRVEDALAAFEEGLKIDPQNSRLQNHRGVDLERLGRLDESRAAYRRAIALDPKDALAHNNLGALAFSRGVEGAAAAHFARAVELDPAFDAPAVNGSLMRASGAGSEAAEAEVLAAALRPGASAAVKARAKAIQADRAVRERRYADARALYQDVVEQDPADASALNNLGVAEDQLGMSREALSHLSEALKRRPGDPNILNNIGVVHVHRGELSAAEAAFREVVHGDPRFHRAWHNLGVVLGAKGDRAGAVDAFRRAAALAPDDASAVYNLAILDRDLGRLDPAGERAAYERALGIDPQLTEAWLSLGTLLSDPATPEAVRDETKARAALQKFLALAYSDDVAGRRQATDWLAWLDAKAKSAPR